MDEPCPGSDAVCGNQIEIYTGPLLFVFIMAALMILMGLGIWLYVQRDEPDDDKPRPTRYRFDDDHLDRPIEGPTP